jgi:hypothetical protein
MNREKVREGLSKIVKEILYEESEPGGPSPEAPGIPGEPSEESEPPVENNVTGTGASFTPGDGAQYATPSAFAVNKAGKNRATKFLEKLGFKQVERPKRPSSTKTADFV